MRLTIKGRNIELTPALKQYANEKLGKITKIFDQIIDVTVTLSIEKNPSITNNQIAEVIVTLKKGRIQSKEVSDNMYASIDLLADKIERQIIKHKTKLINRTMAKSGASTIREKHYGEILDDESDLASLDDDIIKIDVVQEN